MKSSIHPTYIESHVKCTCGNEFVTRATRSEVHVEVCSNCHPFYTGRQKLVDTGGRVERFQRRMAKGRRITTPAGSSPSAAAPSGGQAGATQTQSRPQ
jgi:large subunit ribosomal protein L31